MWSNNYGLYILEFSHKTVLNVIWSIHQANGSSHSPWHYSLQSHWQWCCHYVGRIQCPIQVRCDHRQWVGTCRCDPSKTQIRDPKGTNGLLLGKHWFEGVETQTYTNRLKSFKWLNIEYEVFETLTNKAEKEQERSQTDEEGCVSWSQFYSYAFNYA